MKKKQLQITLTGIQTIFNSSISPLDVSALSILIENSPQHFNFSFKISF